MQQGYRRCTFSTFTFTRSHWSIRLCRAIWTPFNWPWVDSKISKALSCWSIKRISNHALKISRCFFNLNCFKDLLFMAFFQALKQNFNPLPASSCITASMVNFPEDFPMIWLNINAVRRPSIFKSSSCAWHKVHARNARPAKKGCGKAAISRSCSAGRKQTSSCPSKRILQIPFSLAEKKVPGRPGLVFSLTRMPRSGFSGNGWSTWRFKEPKKLQRAKAFERLPSHLREFSSRLCRQYILMCLQMSAHAKKNVWYPSQTQTARKPETSQDHAMLSKHWVQNDAKGRHQFLWSRYRTRWTRWPLLLEPQEQTVGYEHEVHWLNGKAVGPPNAGALMGISFYTFVLIALCHLVVNFKFHQFKQAEQTVYSFSFKKQRSFTGVNWNHSSECDCSKASRRPSFCRSAVSSERKAVVGVAATGARFRGGMEDMDMAGTRLDSIAVKRFALQFDYWVS